MADEKESRSNANEAWNIQVGRQLKAIYKVYEEEPLPEKFLDLLEQLEKAEAEAKRQENRDEVRR